MTKLDNETGELNNDALDNVAGGMRFLGIDLVPYLFFSGPLIGTAIGQAIGATACSEGDATRRKEPIRHSA
jgi:hypothetical protein